MRAPHEETMLSRLDRRQARCGKRLKVEAVRQRCAVAVGVGGGRSARRIVAKPEGECFCLERWIESFFVLLSSVCSVVWLEGRGQVVRAPMTLGSAPLLYSDDTNGHGYSTEVHTGAALDSCL